MTRWCNRLLDLLVAAPLLAVLALPMLLVALLVRLTSRGPALYKQERSGLHGKPFVMFKFRTMRDGAEAETGPVWSKRGDPRCTALGNFLRRFSIDELPQLFNVLRGEMSLVGPRPERPYFVEKFSRELPGYERRLDVPPGITGWAQINGWRGDSSLVKRLEFDLYYNQHCSLPCNLGILLLTPLRVLIENNPRNDPRARPVFCTPLLAAVLLAATLQAVHIVRSATISADGIIFISIARDLPGQFIETLQTEDQHPGYPAMILAATRAVQWLGYRAEPQSWMIGSVAVSYVCGLLSVCAVWLLVRNVFDARVANVSALVFAVLPLPIANAADAQSDVPHLLFYLLAVALASTGVLAGRVFPLAGAAAASGIAYWIRPEGLEVFLVCLVCLAWQSFRADWSWRRLGLASGVLAGVTMMIAAPYALLADKVTSKQLPFAKPYPVQTYINQVALNETVTEASPTDLPRVAESAAGGAVAAAAATHAATGPPTPRYSAPLVMRTLARGSGEFIECLCQGLKYIFIPFYLLGHVAMARRRHEPMHVALLGGLGALHFLALMGVYLLSGYIAARHVLPLVGLAMPLVGLGIIFVGENASRWLHARPTVGVVATLSLAAAVVLPWTTRAVNREFMPVIDATHWVQSYAESGSGVVCNSPYVGFYGTLPTAVLGPHALTLDAALARAESARYDYVVLHVGAHDYRPEWLAEVERRYRQVAHFPDRTGDPRPRKVLVFESLELQARRASGKSQS